MRNSIIRKTGQTWKLAIAVVAMVAGSIVPAFPVAGMSWTVGTIIVVVGYVFGSALIACTACSSRWFWTALTQPETYKAVFTDATCPACGKDFSV